MNYTRRECLTVLGLATVAQARRLLAAHPLEGKWQLSIDVEGTTREGMLVLSVEGSAVKARFGNSSEELRGALIEDNGFKVSGKFYSDEAGYSAEMVLEGKLQPDDTLTGQGSWDIYTFTFTGIRDSS